MTGYAVALGMFDSVHTGHRAVIDGAVNSDYRSIVVTFDDIPAKGGRYILTEEEKRDKLISLGVNDVHILEFEEVKNYPPEYFLEYIFSHMKAKKICCGFNFRFGKNAAGDTGLIKSFCEKKGIEYFVAPEVKSDGETVSTTYIKMLLSEGRVEKAAELLEDAFSFTAPVTEGDKRGRTIGFPTVNQIYPEKKAELKFGVYHTRVEIDGEVFSGVTNVGIRPTFRNDFVSAETYILDYDGDCYGKAVKLSFVEYLREEKEFRSIEELRAEIEKNVQYVSQSI